ncbi:MAG TPA: hypothetical protein VLX68_01190 [Chitinivibrionales bacterium]|nr:hypothetical protein [Chitinivibrionales bacterium]
MDIQNNSTVNAKVIVDDRENPTIERKPYIDEVCDKTTAYIINHPGCTQKEAIKFLKITEVWVKRAFQKMLQRNIIYRGKLSGSGPLGYFMTDHTSYCPCDTGDCIKW